MNSEKRQFTLVELAVVVVAVALLFTLLLPTLCRAQEKGKQVSCMNNLNTCAKAAAQYAAANKGQIYLKCFDYPRNQILYSMINGAPMVTNSHKYLNSTAKYLKGYEEACCPDVINPLTPLPANPKDALKFSSYYAVPYMSYKQGTSAFSSELMRNLVDVRNIKAYDNPRDNKFAAIAMTLPKLQQPAVAFLFAEAWRNNSNGNEAYWHYTFSGSSRIQLRHDGKSNTAFADGHVASLGVEYFKPLVAARNIHPQTKLWDVFGEKSIAVK